jgi:glycosyltransferase involved in cell wall biosynthesis
LENSVLAIPSICQSFSSGDSPYQQQPEDADNLLLADTFDEWISQIERLISDKDFRRKLGEKARNYVLENYNINNEKNYKKWYNAYSKLLDKNE